MKLGEPLAWAVSVVLVGLVSAAPALASMAAMAWGIFTVACYPEYDYYPGY